MIASAAGRDWEQRVAAIYRADRTRVLASLIRLLGDFDLAEEALHDAFAAAIEQWPERGMPENPWRWLVSAGRFKTIDRLRRRARQNAARPDLVQAIDTAAADEFEQEMIEDDSLRLIFISCHPVLPPDAQIALTLREVCGLTTEEIARAFLTSPPTVAQRIVRAKARLREAGIPFAVPDRSRLPERLEMVLRVIYLIFNEGYSSYASAPDPAAGLADEAIRLCRLLADLIEDPEVLGLLALMLFTEARRDARITPDGELVQLADQDRSLWHRAQIETGRSLLDRVYAKGEIGGYGLQAAIAAEHAKAAAAGDTDWSRIAALYDLLLVADPSPVVSLNRAAAIAERDGPAAAVPLMNALLAEGGLASYHFAFAARAEVLRRLGQVDAACADYRRALDLAVQEPDRRFLLLRLQQLGGGCREAVSCR